MDKIMPEKHLSLTEKEKETLRLLVRGYDVKSIARHFGLSVHTINERLRNTRQKLSVSSSREAARMLQNMEAESHNLLGDKVLREASTADAMVKDEVPNDGHGLRILLAMLIIGVIVMSFILAAFTLLPISQDARPVTELSQVASNAEIEHRSDVASSARHWLALVDEYNWIDSWAATGQSFKELNTIEAWASMAEKVQRPLGLVLSRSISDQEAIPAPPSGYEMIKFRTSFEHKPDAVETLALVREDSKWKVVGYYIE